MSEIVLDEITYAAEVLNSHDLDKCPVEKLSRVAKYYCWSGNTKREIRSKLEDFVIECGFSPQAEVWKIRIDFAIKRCDKREIIILDGVPISQEEFEVVQCLGKPTLRRLLFTLIAISKYYNMINKSNNGWVNQEYKDIFKMANIETSSRYQCLMLKDLYSLGLIEYGKKVDNLNIHVNCLSGDSCFYFVTDFRNVGNQYRTLTGENFMKCEKCGLTIKRKSNAQRYCPECANGVERERKRIMREIG